jgi:hypothetical protein
MAAIKQDQEIVENNLCERARFYAHPQEYRTLTVFDRAGGHFLVLDEGWDGFKRIHHVWIHVELRDGKFWVHEDGTQDGVATNLLDAGIPKERIILAFQHPSRRKYGEFAAAA